MSKIKEPPTLQAHQEKGARQLFRLERLMDVVFGLMILRIFFMLPEPSSLKLRAGKHLLDSLAEHQGSYMVILIGIILIIVYWMQNNTQFGNLARTDGRHTTLSILQLFFLLFYLYFVRLGEGEFKNDIDALALQSISLALAGFVSFAGWRYASKDRRLLSDAISDPEARERGVEILTEPVVALITIPFSFVSPAAWTLAWLAIFPIGWMLKRRLPKDSPIPGDAPKG